MDALVTITAIEAWVEQVLRTVSDIAVLLVVFFIVLFPIERFVFGELCRRHAAKKGYKGYFWTGFFLGCLGFIYVIFLPDLKLQKYLRMCSMKMQLMDERIINLESEEQ